MMRKALNLFAAAIGLGLMCMAGLPAQAATDPGFVIFDHLAPADPLEVALVDTIDHVPDISLAALPMLPLSPADEAMFAASIREQMAGNVPSGVTILAPRGFPDLPAPED